jgi:hypothetical protein
MSNMKNTALGVSSFEGVVKGLLICLCVPSIKLMSNGGITCL